MYVEHRYEAPDSRDFLTRLRESASESERERHVYDLLTSAAFKLDRWAYPYATDASELCALRASADGLHNLAKSVERTAASERDTYMCGYWRVLGRDQIRGLAV